MTMHSLRLLLLLAALMCCCSYVIGRTQYRNEAARPRRDGNTDDYHYQYQYRHNDEEGGYQYQYEQHRDAESYSRTPSRSSYAESLNFDEKYASADRAARDANVIRWIGGASSAWSSADNWDMRRVPTQHDTVIINSDRKQVHIQIPAGTTSVRQLIVQVTHNNIELHGFKQNYNRQRYRYDDAVELDGASSSHLHVSSLKLSYRSDSSKALMSLHSLSTEILVSLQVTLPSYGVQSRRLLLEEASFVIGSNAKASIGAASSTSDDAHNHLAGDQFDFTISDITAVSSGSQTASTSSWINHGQLSIHQSTAFHIYFEQVDSTHSTRLIIDGATDVLKSSNSRVRVSFYRDVNMPHGKILLGSQTASVQFNSGLNILHCIDYLSNVEQPSIKSLVYVPTSFPAAALHSPSSSSSPYFGVACVGVSTICVFTHGSIVMATLLIKNQAKLYIANAVNQQQGQSQSYNHALVKIFNLVVDVNANEHPQELNGNTYAMLQRYLSSSTHLQSISRHVGFYSPEIPTLLVSNWIVTFQSPQLNVASHAGTSTLRLHHLNVNISHEWIIQVEHPIIQQANIQLDVDVKLHILPHSFAHINKYTSPSSGAAVDAPQIQFQYLDSNSGNTYSKILNSGELKVNIPTFFHSNLFENKDAGQIKLLYSNSQSVASNSIHSSPTNASTNTTDGSHFILIPILIAISVIILTVPTAKSSSNSSVPPLNVAAASSSARASAEPASSASPRFSSFHNILDATSEAAATAAAAITSPPSSREHEAGNPEFESQMKHFVGASVIAVALAFINSIIQTFNQASTKPIILQTKIQFSGFATFLYFLYLFFHFFVFALLYVKKSQKSFQIYFDHIFHWSLLLLMLELPDNWPYYLQLIRDWFNPFTHFTWLYHHTGVHHYVHPLTAVACITLLALTGIALLYGVPAIIAHCLGSEAGSNFEQFRSSVYFVVLYCLSFEIPLLMKFLLRCGDSVSEEFRPLRHLMQHHTGLQLAVLALMIITIAVLIWLTLNRDRNHVCRVEHEMSDQFHSAVPIQLFAYALTFFLHLFIDSEFVKVCLFFIIQLILVRNSRKLIATMHKIEEQAAKDFWYILDVIRSSLYSILYAIGVLFIFVTVEVFLLELFFGLVFLFCVTSVFLLSGLSIFNNSNQ